MAAAPSRATTRMLSCLRTSAQAADLGPVFMALEQALDRPGNVATEPVRGAQSTWLTGEMGEDRTIQGPGERGASARNSSCIQLGTKAPLHWWWEEMQVLVPR